MAFVREAREAAVTWKEAASLPDGAKAAAPYARRHDRVYPFCLPVEHAYCNLLAGARGALQSFARDGIVWHDGVGDGPSNHLLDSQIQCVNALAPFVRDGSALSQLFGSVLDVAEVVPFLADEPTGDLVTFEWIGAADYLSERTTGGTRRRGAFTTSADAAIRYRTSSGSVEVALVEWKYTERYQGHELGGGESSMRVRNERYRALYDDRKGPVRASLIPYSDLFVEPFYQLLRLTLLADQMERSHEQGAERVRLVYVAPSRNTALWTSLNRASHQDLAVQLVDSDPRPVEAVWSAMCRRPDTFVYMDSATFVADGSPTSDEFRSRYRHLAGERIPSSGA